MSELKNLEAGSRHDLRFGISPDAPDVSQFQDEADGAFGWAHSYETASRYDGPGSAGRAVRLGMPASLSILPQSRYLALEGRHLHLGATSD